MKPTKLVALAGTLAASVITADAALAGTPNNFTLQDWITTGYNANGGAATAGVVVDQDKIWRYISNTPSLDAASVDIETFANSPTPGVDTHQLVLSDLPTTPWTGTLRYSIEIDLSLTPLNTFRDASIDTDVPAANPGVEVTKVYYSDAFTTSLASLTSTNGAASGPTTAIAGYTKIWVELTIDADAGSILNSISDTYTERVPEPATLGLLGLGLAGIASRRRLRKAAIKG